MKCKHCGEEIYKDDYGIWTHEGPLQLCMLKAEPAPEQEAKPDRFTPDELHTIIQWYHNMMDTNSAYAEEKDTLLFKKIRAIYGKPAPEQEAKPDRLAEAEKAIFDICMAVSDDRDPNRGDVASAFVAIVQHLRERGERWELK